MIAICIMVTTWEWNWRGKELEEGLAVTKDLTSSAEESVMAIATMAEPIMSNPPPEGSAALSISHMDPYGCMSTCEVWSNGGPKLLGCSVFFDIVVLGCFGYLDFDQWLHQFPPELSKPPIPSESIPKL